MSAGATSNLGQPSSRVQALLPAQLPSKVGLPQCMHCVHSPLQALQDRVKQLEAAATTTAATTDTSMSELRIQLEAERAEARKAKMEASSTSKQFEQLVQRLRREADASKPCVLNLACCRHVRGLPHSQCWSSW